MPRQPPDEIPRFSRRWIILTLGVARSTSLFHSLLNMKTNRRQFIQSASGLLVTSALVSTVRADTIAPAMKAKIVTPDQGTSVWAMGIHVTVRFTSKDTDGAYSVFEDVVSPGAGPPLHTHTKEDETMFVLEGELEVTLGEQIATVRPGTFVHMPRGVPHCFKNVTDRTAKMLLSYTPGGFEQWFLDIGTPAINASADPASSLAPDDIKRAVAAAERYGVTFSKPK